MPAAPTGAALVTLQADEIRDRLFERFVFGALLALHFFSGTVQRPLLLFFGWLLFLEQHFDLNRNEVAGQHLQPPFISHSLG